MIIVLVSQRWTASGLRCKSAVCNSMPIYKLVSMKQFGLEVVLTASLLLRMLIKLMRIWERS